MESQWFQSTCGRQTLPIESKSLSTVSRNSLYTLYDYTTTNTEYFTVNLVEVNIVTDFIIISIGVSENLESSLHVRFVEDYAN